jgi:hypothetical protein
VKCGGAPDGGVPVECGDGTTKLGSYGSGRGSFGDGTAAVEVFVRGVEAKALLDRGVVLVRRDVMDAEQGTHHGHCECFAFF